MNPGISVDSPVLSKRAAKSEQRQEQIIQAAVEVLQERGVADTSMNDIIRASGLSKGGVYHHFASKEALLVGVIEHFFAQYVSDFALDEYANLTAYEKMRLLLTEREATLERVGQLNQLMLDLLGYATSIPSIKTQFYRQYCHFQDHLAVVINEGIAAGEFRADTDARVVASGIMSLFDGMCTALLVAKDRVQFPQYAVQCALLLLEAIRVPESS